MFLNILTIWQSIFSLFIMPFNLVALFIILLAIQISMEILFRQKKYIQIFYPLLVL